jgi:hypothetical protein
MRGWLGLINRYSDVHRQVPYYDRLVGLMAFFAEWYVLRIGTMDLKIASIVLVHGATVIG